VVTPSAGNRGREEVGSRDVYDGGDELGWGAEGDVGCIEVSLA
jgi:hypothetical protein